MTAADWMGFEDTTRAVAAAVAELHRPCHRQPDEGRPSFALTVGEAGSWPDRWTHAAVLVDDREPVDAIASALFASFGGRQRVCARLPKPIGVRALLASHGPITVLGIEQYSLDVDRFLRRFEVLSRLA